jgi:adenosylcobinamide-GDP ribazoletransferase
VKVTSLALFAPIDGAMALLAAHMGARAVPVVASAFIPYAGGAGAKVAPMNPSRNRILMAVACGLLPFLVLPWVPAFTALIAASLASAGLLGKARRLIGGQTGDVLGASEQVFETVVLLALAGFA